MATNADLEEWVLEALDAHGGEAALPRIAQHIWEHHEDDLRQSGDMFYTWQYGMRWASQRLQRAGKLEKPRRGIWRLAR